MNENLQDKLETKCKELIILIVAPQISSFLKKVSLIQQDLQVENTPALAVKTLIDLAITKKDNLISLMIHTQKAKAHPLSKHMFLDSKILKNKRQIKLISRKSKQLLNQIQTQMTLTIPTHQMIQTRKLRKSEELQKKPN